MKSTCLAAGPRGSGAATFHELLQRSQRNPATGNAYFAAENIERTMEVQRFCGERLGKCGEMIPHGYARDNYEAAMLAANAGSDMDMESRSYIQHLAKLVKEGK